MMCKGHSRLALVFLSSFQQKRLFYMQFGMHYAEQTTLWFGKNEF